MPCFSRCSATASASDPPRTAAVPRASAVVARSGSTVLPRVSCVTPLRRVQGREVTTLEGLDPIVLVDMDRGVHGSGREPVRLLHPGHHHATGCADRTQAVREFRGLVHCACRAPVPMHGMEHHPRRCNRRTRGAANARSEGKGFDGKHCQALGPSSSATRRLRRVVQRSRVERTRRWMASVAAGLGGFADDSSPAGALVAVPDGTGGWSLAGTSDRCQTPREEGSGT